jgi:hypothetical protein
VYPQLKTLRSGRYFDWSRKVDITNLERYWGPTKYQLIGSFQNHHKRASSGIQDSALHSVVLNPRHFFLVEMKLPLDFVVFQRFVDASPQQAMVGMQAKSNVLIALRLVPVHGRVVERVTGYGG